MYVHIDSCYRVRKDIDPQKKKKIHYMVIYINSGIKTKLFQLCISFLIALNSPWHHLYLTLAISALTVEGCVHKRSLMCVIIHIWVNVNVSKCGCVHEWFDTCENTVLLLALFSNSSSQALRFEHRCCFQWDSACLFLECHGRCFTSRLISDLL